MVRRLGFVGLAVLLSAGSALAESKSTVEKYPAGTVFGTTRQAVVTRVEKPADPLISPIVFMNRCVGGCQLTVGASNASAIDNRATLGGPANAMVTMSEFANSFGDLGANGHCVGTLDQTCTQDSDCDPGSSCETADKQWEAVVKCMKEVYSPYNVEIVDERPTNGSTYHMAMLAGLPSDVGVGPGILGIASITGDCSPIDNTISFSFANAHNPADRVNNMCWTVAQETAHAFGLDHAFSFVAGNRSACNDPMTYRTDCGGQKFFRNDTARCGEDTIRECRCGGTQNSHIAIRNVFGEGVSIVPAPTTSILFPKTGATIQNGIKVSARGFSQRGIAKIELYINGRKWSEQVGAAFGGQGQPESTYQLDIPAMVPDSVMDIKVRAYDDLLVMTESAVETITKGKACTDDASCVLTGMTCSSDGKCAWPEPTGELGASCTFNEFCVSNVCAMTVDGGVCTTPCFPGLADQCEAGYTCEPTGMNAGVCLGATDDGGCCSVGSDPRGAWIHGGIGLALLGFVLRRRSNKGPARSRA